MVEKIFLFHAKAQSGKNFCADYMKEVYEKRNKRVLVIAFADWVKDCMRRYFGIEEYKTEAGRTAITNFATDICRKKDPEIWARVVATTVKAMEECWDVVIIPDWRFKNEAEIMEKYFPGKVVKVLITRPDVENIDNMTKIQRSHLSETELDNFQNWDYNIINETGKVHSTFIQLEKMIAKENERK